MHVTADGHTSLDFRDRDPPTTAKGEASSPTAARTSLGTRKPAKGSGLSLRGPSAICLPDTESERLTYGWHHATPPRDLGGYSSLGSQMRNHVLSEHLNCLHDLLRLETRIVEGDNH